MTRGVKGIFGVNVFVVPLLILFSMIVVADSFIFSESRNAGSVGLAASLGLAVISCFLRGFEFIACPSSFGSAGE